MSDETMDDGEWIEGALGSRFKVVDEDPERDERLTRRTKFIAEGAETLLEVIEMTADWLKDLCKLRALGFDLTEPVSDGYLHLEKEG